MSENKTPERTPPRGVSLENVADVFRHHPPRTEEDVRRHEAVRAGALAFAQVILLNCPNCADRSTALRHVRDAMMNANASIALDGLI